MNNFNHKLFKSKALEQIGPTVKVYGFDPMIIITILSALAPILSNCINKVNPVEAAKRIKAGDSNTKLALTKAIKESLTKRGEKSNSESREALRNSFTSFLCSCDDKELEGLCTTSTKPDFGKLAL